MSQILESQSQTVMPHFNLIGLTIVVFSLSIEQTIFTMSLETNLSSSSLNGLMADILVCIYYALLK